MNWKPVVHCQIQVYSVSLAKSRKENEHWRLEGQKSTPGKTESTQREFLKYML